MLRSTIRAGHSLGNLVLLLVKAGHNLGNLVLLLVQLELDEELCKHDIDAVQSDVGLTELMLRV